MFLVFTISVIFLVGAFSLHYFYRLLFPKRELWNGPEGDKNQQSRIVGDILLKYPDLPHLRAAFKDEAKTATAVQEYLDLERQNLCDEEYEKRLDEIIKNINIDDIIG